MPGPVYPRPIGLKGRLASVIRNESRWGFNEDRALRQLYRHAGDITPTQDRVMRELFRNAAMSNGFDENRAFEIVLDHPYLNGEQANEIIRIAYDARRYPNAQDYDRMFDEVIYRY